MSKRVAIPVFLITTGIIAGAWLATLPAHERTIPRTVVLIIAAVLIWILARKNPK